MGGSKTEPQQKPERLQQLETNLTKIDILLPALEKESLEATKVLVELVQLKIEKIDFQKPILYYSSLENSQKLDSLEKVRQSLARDQSLAIEGLAFQDLIHYETLKKEFLYSLIKPNLICKI